MPVAPLSINRYQEVPELKTQLARETASLNEDCEAAKEKARASFA
jgi:hypothetical protein